MQKKFLWLAVLLPVMAQAQLGGLLKNVKDKVNQRIEKKVDNAIEKKLDEIEGVSQPATATTSEKDGPVASKEPGVKGYSKFDFVPGEKIIFAEDFGQDALGELPLSWNSSGKGEVMTLNSQQGKWLRIFQNATYLSGNTKDFGENYTVEFDLVYFFDPKVKGYVLPGWKFGIFSSDGADPASNNFLKEHSEAVSVDVRFGFGSYALSQIEAKKNKGQTFLSDRMPLGDVLPWFNKVVHYSLQVQKTRFRLWIDDKKVFDLPRAVPVDNVMNQLVFSLEGSNYKEDELGLYVSNIKVATGLPDTRHKLVEEGKFSTTGILFDVNAATIKPESNGVLKEVAEAIKSSSGMKVKITGHTDSDGTDANNLALSKKRAEAVKEFLVTNHGVDAASLESDGKGASQPVSDNKTKEGKAQNRRVEFTKL